MLEVVELRGARKRTATAFVAWTAANAARRRAKMRVAHALGRRGIAQVLWNTPFLEALYLYTKTRILTKTAPDKHVKM